MSDPDRAIIDALWGKVVQDFSSAKPHQAFLEQCQRSDQLVEAARRYREHKDSLPKDDEQSRSEADKHLDAIAIRAIARLDESRSSPEPSRLMRVLSVLIAMLTLIAVTILMRALLF